MEIASLWPLVGVPVLRSIAGWAENSLADGKIDKYEWAQLGETIVRIGTMGSLAYFGLNGAGVDVTALGAAAGAAVLDFILRAFKSKDEAKKK